MKKKIYWRTSITPFGHSFYNHELIEAIKNSNIPEEYKIPLIIKAGSYNSRKDSEDYNIREIILNTLIENNKPMRIKDFVYEENAPLHNICTIQRATAQMHELYHAGIVRRFEEETGKKIEIAPGELVSERIIYFEIRG